MREAFLKRVDAYVELHRRLEANLPPEVITEDPQALFVPRYALAREIRRARAGARQGELLTPATAVYFKELVTRTLNESGIGDFLAIVEEENTVTLVPQVNGDYPAGASISFMPPSLLAALPARPKELQYRFIGRTLIIWDVHAGLIVDFAPRVLKEFTETIPD